MEPEYTEWEYQMLQRLDLISDQLTAQQTRLVSIDGYLSALDQWGSVVVYGIGFLAGLYCVDLLRRALLARWGVPQ